MIFFAYWRHHKNNVVLTVPPEPKKKERGSRSVSSRNQQTTARTAVTWTTTITATVGTTATTTTTQKKKKEEGKNPESYEKRVPHPLEQVPEKIESFIPPSVTRTVLAAPKNITTSIKFFMDANVARKWAKKKLDFRNN